MSAHAILTRHQLAAAWWFSQIQ